MEEIFKNMKFDNNSQMKQAENIWKMLDNMSENNPEVYFIYK